MSGIGTVTFKVLTTIWIHWLTNYFQILSIFNLINENQPKSRLATSGLSTQQICPTAASNASLGGAVDFFGD